MESGLESLKYAVLRDTEKGENCFNENGCDHVFTETRPADAQAKKFGFDTQCVKVSQCFHKYCDRFRWAADRFEYYSNMTGIPVDDIARAFEEVRTYWYMNYYQESNLPKFGRHSDPAHVGRMHDRIVEIHGKISSKKKCLNALHQEYDKEEIELLNKSIVALNQEGKTLVATLKVSEILSLVFQSHQNIKNQ